MKVKVYLKYPPSPQPVPQEFFIIQYFSPEVSSLPYPTNKTAWFVSYECLLTMWGGLFEIVPQMDQRILFQI